MWADLDPLLISAQWRAAADVEIKILCAENPELLKVPFL